VTDQPTNQVAMFSPDLPTWLVAHAPPEAPYLLAHATDGVIWGRVDGGRLIRAGEAFPGEPAIDVALRSETLQTARLFGPEGELYVWRVGSRFGYRLLVDEVGGPETAVFADQQRLWGTRGERGRENRAAGFTLLVDGRQGLRHAPPVVGLMPDQRVALRLQHYVAYDAVGQAYVSESRLVDLVIE